MHALREKQVAGRWSIISMDGSWFLPYPWIKLHSKV
jgi:hypothetical protein